MRLGAAMGMLPVKLATLDALLEQVQDANLQALMESAVTGRALDEKRAECIRAMLKE